MMVSPLTILNSVTKKNIVNPASLAAALERKPRSIQQRRDSIQHDSFVWNQVNGEFVAALEEAAKAAGISLEIRPDRHFFTTDR